MTAEHKAKIIKVNTGRIVSEETRQKLSKINKGRKLPKIQVLHNVISHYTTKYRVYRSDNVEFIGFSETDVYKFFKLKYNVSRIIVHKLIHGNYIPTFNKHQFLSDFKILLTPITEEERKLLIQGVSTNPDECKGVE